MLQLKINSNEFHTYCDMDWGGYTQILKRKPGGPDAPTSKNATGDLYYFKNNWDNYEKGLINLLI